MPGTGRERDSAGRRPWPVPHARVARWHRSGRTGPAARPGRRRARPSSPIWRLSWLLPFRSYGAGRPWSPPGGARDARRFAGDATHAPTCIYTRLSIGVTVKPGPTAELKASRHSPTLPGPPTWVGGPGWGRVPVRGQDAAGPGPGRGPVPGRETARRAVGPATAP